MAELAVAYDTDFISRIAALVNGRSIRLASKSPRRREILTSLGVKFEVFVPRGERDFEAAYQGDDPVARSVAVTRHKAEQGSNGFSEGILIAADTIVVLDGEVLSKPLDRQEAVSHLTRLAGRDHHVYTTMVVRDLDRGTEAIGTSDSKVTFKEVSKSDILKYVESGEPDDKAGAYGIQGMGKFLVENFTGSLDNIIGFPALLFAGLLERLGRRQDGQ